MVSFRDALPNLNCNIRLIHAAAGAPAIDVYCNGTLVASNIKFSNVTGYISISPGNVKFEVFNTGTYDNPLSTENVILLPQSTNTICMVLEESSLVTFKLDDAFPKTKPPLTNLRFINLSTNAPLLSLSLPNGDTLFNGVEYLENTRYYSMSAGIYDLLLTATNDASFRKYLNDVDLSSGLYHTIYVIGLTDTEPKLGYLFVKDGF